MRAIVVVALLVIAGRSDAQPVAPEVFDQLEENRLIRVWTPMFTFDGLYHHRDGDRIVIDTSRGFRAIELSAIEKVEAARSRSLRTTMIGAGIGAGAGVVLPFALQALFFGGCCEYDAEATAASVLILGGVGAVIGAVLGPSSQRWERLAGDSGGARVAGSAAPPIASIAVHGGGSMFGRMAKATTEPGDEHVRDGKLALDITLLYRHLIPGELGVSLLYTTFERPSDISPAPTDGVVVAGMDYRLPLPRRTLAPYLGAGIKYITSETSTTEKGRQRALGVDAVIGARLNLNPRWFAEVEARAIYGAVELAGDTRYRFATVGGGLGFRY